MKIPARVLAPVILALVCAIALIAFLWWQLQQSTSVLNIPLPDFLSTQTAQPKTTPTNSPIDPYDTALVALRQGDLFALRGEWKDAQEEYENAVKAEGGLPALRKLAQAQLQRRDINGARATLKKMRSAGARSEDLVLLESIIELRSGELRKAQTLLENAAESPQKHYGLALLAVIQGNHEIAKAELQQVVNGWEPVLRSYARTLQSAYDEFVLFPDGSNLHLITLLSRALAQNQECELALPLLVQVTSAQDDYRDAWIVQGYCELITERSEEALVSLEQAYNLDPQKPETQYFLARAYAALEQHQNAITFLEYALVNGFEPKEEVRRLIATEALENGDAQLALEQYDALTRSDDASFEMFEGFITASLALGNTEEAYLKAQQATERWPQNASAFELLGLACAETDRTEEARRAYETALEIDPLRDDARKKIEELP
ncbi:MAG: tetratricopeptide repeat protein [Candidatus Peribacteraceae bacterium]|jgi:tetratricopeptide (TPR) repeat protein